MRESDSKVRCSTRGNEIVTYPVNALLRSPLDFFESMSCHFFETSCRFFETRHESLCGLPPQKVVAQRRLTAKKWSREYDDSGPSKAYFRLQACF